ncbi:MAG: bifunctional hydroxymethylpyrimidine kinase/phosphomethylpyrimidine kinase [Bacillota bacterium]
MVPRAITIAGSDSGGGAGIQADLKTFTSLRVFGMSAITAITAQNTLGVLGVQRVAPDVVRLQIQACVEDIGVDASKTGMLCDAEIVAVVAEAMKEFRLPKLVVDPVMVSKSGHRLLAEDAVRVLREKLLPLALVVTPNLAETSVLTGMDVNNLERMERAARLIHSMGPQFVVVKGGHLGRTGQGKAADLVYDGRDFTVLEKDWVDTKNTHGTGCTFSAAITGYLALGYQTLDAIRKGKEFVTWALRHSFSLGQGHGPTNHFYPWEGCPQA